MTMAFNSPYAIHVKITPREALGLALKGDSITPEDLVDAIVEPCRNIHQAWTYSKAMGCYKGVSRI